jgi:hypothetical protein
LYNKFLRCTHTDTTRNVSDQELNEVHRFLTEHKAMLVAREKPMPGMGLPRTHAEWEAMKQKATEAKKAKRAASLARR